MIVKNIKARDVIRVVTIAIRISETNSSMELLYFDVNSKFHSDDKPGERQVEL